jgi:hypothetical protein
VHRDVIENRDESNIIILDYDQQRKTPCKVLNVRVHFLNILLFLAGPEGLGRNNFKNWTQSEIDA